MSTRTNARPLFISRAALAVPDLPAPLRTKARQMARDGSTTGIAHPLVIALASEIADGSADLPGWASGASARFLVIVDAPSAVLLRAVSRLDLRRPDQRMHATADVGAVRRFVVASARGEPALGIVDAYVWGDALTVVTGDLEARSFPVSKVGILAGMPAEERAGFEIDEDGSFLHWPARDVHLGVSQLLQAVDPMYLVDVAIERNAADLTGAALRTIREEKKLRQADVPGLSERQVRRVEDGISRLRVETARKFASAFGMEVGELVDEIARRAGTMRQLRTNPRTSQAKPTRSASAG
jgi:hypothetical protein